MEFILEGQARYDARVAKDEERLTRLEEALLTLVEIARMTDERQDETDQRVDRFDSKLTALAEAQLVSQFELTELAKGLNSLIDVVERYISKGNNGTAQAS